MTSMTPAFGLALRKWRLRRRLSQLELGLAASVSARHISFLETGRSNPSREMVLHLCDQLEVPRQARNHLLTTAGLAPAYSHRDLSEAEMEPIRAAIDWMLEHHEPFPALAMNRHWVIVKMNRVAKLLLSAVGLHEGASMLSSLTEDPAFRNAVENLDELVEHILARLRTESAHYGSDDILDAAIAALSKLHCGPPRETGRILPPFVPAIYNANGTRLALLSTIAQFGTAEDVALSELRIELIFPADLPTRSFLFQLAQTQ